MVSVNRLSALAGVCKAGEFGGDGQGGAGVVLAARRPAALAQINGAPALEKLQQRLVRYQLREAPAARRATSGGDLTLLWNGPGMWLAESPGNASADFMAGLRDALAGSDATVTDLSHARTVVRVSGPQASDLLLRGCPLDIEAMTEGDCATSLLEKLTVTLHALGNQRFDLYVYRSFGLAMWEWLVREAQEFGYRVGDPLFAVSQERS